MIVNDKFSNCEFCKHRFNQCEHCNPNYKATDNFVLDEMAYYDERRIRQDEREKIITDLENEIQNFNEVRDSKTIDFIYDFIEELKGDKR